MDLFFFVCVCYSYLCSVHGSVLSLASNSSSYSSVSLGSMQTQVATAQRMLFVWMYVGAMTLSSYFTL